MGYKIERMGRLVLQTRVFFLLLHMFKSHVGAQEAFFSKLPAAMRDSDSGLSPSPLSRCTQQNENVMINWKMSF